MGEVSVAADLNLAPLADGEYAIELVVGSGGETERRVDRDSGDAVKV